MTTATMTTPASTSTTTTRRAELLADLDALTARRDDELAAAAEAVQVKAERYRKAQESELFFRRELAAAQLRCDALRDAAAQEANDLRRQIRESLSLTQRAAADRLFADIDAEIVALQTASIDRDNPAKLAAKQARIRALVAVRQNRDEVLLAADPISAADGIRKQQKV